MHEMHLESDVFMQWCQVGLDEGLKTHSQIARFLLERFQSSRDMKHIHTHTCAFCSAPLPSICAHCNTFTSHDITSVASQAIATAPASVPGLSSVGGHSSAVVTGLTKVDHALAGGHTTAPCHSSGVAASVPAVEAGEKGAGSITLEPGRDVTSVADWNSLAANHNNTAVTPQAVKEVAEQDSSAQDSLPLSSGGHNTRQRSRRTRQPNGVRSKNIKSSAKRRDARLYKCGLCDKAFSKAGGLSRHIVSCHGGRSKDKTAGARDKLRVDEDEETDELEPSGYSSVDSQPPQPPKADKSKCKSVRTKGTPPQRSSWLCQVCGGVYASKGSLRYHMRIHAGDKPFVCSQCHRAFNYSSHLTRHLRIHSGERPYLCTQCGATFTQKNDLNQHMHRHSGLKPFKCNVCGKWCSTAGDLRIHMVAHSDLRPFKCLECGVSFARESSRVKHMRTHTGEKPFKCRDCDVAYSDSSTLRRHRKRKHEEGVQSKAVAVQISVNA